MDKTAIEQYQKDARFRMLAMSVAAEIMDDLRKTLDHDSLSMADVNEAALRSAMTAIKRVIDGDAELTAMRIERDHYRKIAESALMSRPMPVLIQMPSTS